MFLPTLGIAMSLTVSAVYLTYYSISEKLRDQLEKLNIQGILVMTFCLVFAFIGTEWAPRQPLGFYFLFLTALLLMVALVLIQYDKLRAGVLWTTASFALGGSSAPQASYPKQGSSSEEQLVDGRCHEVDGTSLRYV